jgi:MYXO-CTERM domain-containing protein
MKRERAARWLVAAVTLASSGPLGCGVDHTGRLVAAIRGGEPAPADSNVVAVVNFAGGHCSGSLLTPHLVLSARHCVADTFDKDAPVICGETDFRDPDSPGAVFVVAKPEITSDPADYRALGEIVLPEGVASDLCGTDVVLLVLKEPIEGIRPLEPRLDVPVAAGEHYSAVGFGVDEAEDGHPAGVRKRLDDLQVECSGDQCQFDDIRGNEWLGSGGPCSGDSGGPALDVDGRVIGVVSRGTDGCGEPVFGDVASRSEWLRAQAIRVAQLYAEPPPDWVPCDEANPCPVEEPQEPVEHHLDSSCQINSSRPATSSGLLFAAAALGMLRRRRR